MDKIRLFFLPFAGGSAAFYLPWKKHLDPRIEMYPLELPGRGKRFSAPFHDSLMETVADLYHSIRLVLDEPGFALFGHSMGSWLAYELAYLIIENGHSCPVHLFLSGRYPPQIVKKPSMDHCQSDRAIVAGLVKMGGTPRELLESREWLEMIIPVLRADYKLLDTYSYSPKAYKLNCGITALTGKQDYITTPSEVAKWREHTTRSCRVCEYDGGHFFLNNKTVEIARMINSTLLTYSDAVHLI